jgi:RNA polymerase sigma factor (sigma-70 family)
MLNFDEIYKEQFPRLIIYGKNNGLQESDAKDLAQNVMMDFYRKMQNGRVSEYSSGYIFQLAKWRIIDRHREVSAKDNATKCIGDENDLDSLPEEKEENWSTKEKWDIVLRAIKMVKSKFYKKHFEYFEDRIIHGKSSAEISKKYNVKASAVYLSKHRVMKKVVRAAKQIILEEEHGIQSV